MKLIALFKSTTFLVIVMTTAIHSDLFAQIASGGKSNGILPNVVTASPDAASLGKFGVWPVSQYTGVPNISIPLYTIKVKNFELPITLSYHAGGVKIDDISSAVSTGWALNAGGAITRAIVGLPDEDGFQNQFGTLETFKSSYDLNDPSDYVFLRRVLSQQLDTEPDVYTFNLGGVAGRFFTDGQGNFQSLPVSNLKILKSPFSSNPAFGADNIINNWIIADPTGNIYILGSSSPPVGGYSEGNGVELTRSVAPVPAPPSTPMVTAWNVSKIILANKIDTIFLDYGLKTEVYTLPMEQSLRTVQNLSALGAYPPLSGETWQSELSVDQVLYNGKKQTYAIPNKFIATGKSLLSKIRWRGGYIDFLSNTARQDMQNNTGKMLDAINVYNVNSSRIKSFNLKYTYVQQRYYLDSLIEMGSDLLSKRKHSFEYIQRESLPPSRGLSSLPASNSQDHWGFYNGKGNQSLLPPNANMPGSVVALINANRDPDTIYSQYGTLKKIIYPTGGNTQFEYESNRYDPLSPIGGGAPSAPIIAASTTVESSKTAPYERSSMVTIPFSQTDINMVINFHDYGKPPNKSQSYFTYVKIELQTGSTYTQKYYWDSFDNFPGSTPPLNPNGLYDFDVSQTFLSLGPGTYRITVGNNCVGVGCFDEPPIMPWATARLNYSVYGTPPTQPAVLVGGGLRVKKIMNYDHTSSFIDGKKYSYNTGNLLTYPNYFHSYEEDVWKKTLQSTNPTSGELPYYCITLMVDFKEVTSSSQTILGITQGSSVGYTRVKEFEINSSGIDKGYADYGFSFQQDSLNAFQFDGLHWPSMTVLNPIMPVNSFEYKRGLLMSKDIFKKGITGNYIKVQSLVNDYDFNDYKPLNRYKRIRAMRVKQLRFVDYPCGTSLDGYIIPPTGSGSYEFKSDIGYAFYDVITSWVQMKSTTETQYDQDGNNPLVTVSNYQYDNSIHQQPTRIERIRSDGKKDLTTTTYAFDYADNTGFIKEMKDNYQISSPIEQVKYLYDGTSYKIAAGNISTYKLGGKGFKDQERIMENTGAIGLSSFKFSNQLTGALPFSTANTNFANDVSYKTRLNYLSYDDTGGPLSLKLENGPTICYVWSYNKQYPVAEIKNADYAAVVTALNGATAVNDFANSIPASKTVIDDFLAPIRNSLTTFKDAQIISYSYEPLVGIRSVTDAKGMTTYYEYDGFQRLKAIKDQDGNIIKSYDYHYKP